jgi:hypothetical protein
MALRLADAATGQIKKLTGRTISKSNTLAPDHHTREMPWLMKTIANPTNWNRLDSARAG